MEKDDFGPVHGRLKFVNDDEDFEEAVKETKDVLDVIIIKFWVYVKVMRTKGDIIVYRMSRRNYRIYISAFRKCNYCVFSCKPV